jgi:hypothetical protein
MQEIKASARKVDSPTGAIIEAAPEEAGTAGERSSRIHVEGSGVKGQRTLAEVVRRRRWVYRRRGQASRLDPRELMVLGNGRDDSGH